MALFNLDNEYRASFVPYRHSSGYVAKGTVFFRDDPVEIFEVYGNTLQVTTDAARMKAEDIYRRLKDQQSEKPKARRAAKN